MNNISVSFYTLGCRVNQYEEQALREEASAKGLSIVDFNDGSDYSIINTCAVTSESERKSRNIISRAIKKGSRVIVTGCYAELLNKSNRIITGVYYIGGCKQKTGIIDMIISENLPVYSHIPGYEPASIGNTGSLPKERFRAYVKIQDGCNGKCSYCIIPFLRGQSCSRPWGDIIDEINRLALSGVKEVILTGIETSDYNDIPLHELVKKVSGIEGIERIRLGSLNISCINEAFVDTLRNCDKFCRHIHLSLQSGCDRILKIMRRPYNIKKAEEKINMLYRKIPGILISADIISSFPSETEDEFNETLAFLKKYRFSHIHAFPYSPRPHTTATNFLGSVPADEKKRRNNLIIECSEKNKTEIFKDKLNNKVYILIEQKKQDVCYGHTGDFLEAEIKNCTAAIGEIICARVTGYDRTLICEV